MVILILLVRGDVTWALAGNVYHPVVRGKHLLGVCAVRVLEPRVKAAQILSIEEPDAWIFRTDRLLRPGGVNLGRFSPKSFPQGQVGKGENQKRKEWERS